MKAIVVFFLLPIFFFCPFVASDTVDDFHNGLIMSLFVIEHAKTETPTMVSTLNNMEAGIVNLYNYAVTNADLANSASAIETLYQKAQLALTGQVDTTKYNVDTVVSLLTSLMGLLPANTQSFQTSVTSHGGIGGLISAAIPYVNQLFDQFPVQN